MAKVKKKKKYPNITAKLTEPVKDFDELVSRIVRVKPDEIPPPKEPNDGKLPDIT